MELISWEFKHSIKLLSGLLNHKQWYITVNITKHQISYYKNAWDIYIIYSITHRQVMRLYKPDLQVHWCFSFILFPSRSQPKKLIILEGVPGASDKIKVLMIKYILYKLVTKTMFSGKNIQFNTEVFLIPIKQRISKMLTNGGYYLIKK